MLQNLEAWSLVPKPAHPAQPLRVLGLPGLCHIPAMEQPGHRARGCTAPSCHSLLPELQGPSLLRANLKSSPLQDVPAPERARAPSLHAGAGCCSDGSCCAGGSLRNIFPLPKDCSSGARPCKHNECHLIAAALGLGLLGNGCVANILNNSLCNVCPGYCGIHFIIRALGCTLLIILSNNLHSTVSV